MVELTVAGAQLAVTDDIWILALQR